MDRIGVGVVGLGRFGPRHCQILAQLPQVELVAVCSRSEERAWEIAEKTGAKKWFTDYEEMMKDPDVEAVDICTELARHTEIAAAALQRDKHVFSEILLSKSLGETDQLISLREESGTIFMVGFTERFDVRRSMVKSRIDSGDLGDLVSLYGRRNCIRRALDNPRDKPDPLVLQPGIHTMDLLLWMAGERVREVYARSRSMVDPERVDSWWAMLTFESGMTGVIEQSFFVPDNGLFWCDFHLEVVGTEGTAKVSEPSDASVIWTQDATISPDLYHSPELHGRVVGALEAELACFVDCVKEGANPVHGSLQQARDALELGLAIVASAEQGAPVRI